MKGVKSKNLFIKVELDEEKAEQNEREVEDDEVYDDDEDIDDQEGGPEDAQPVAFFTLFRFSTKFEWMLGVAGVVMAWVGGILSPMVLIIFARFANALIKYGALVTANQCVNETTNVTQDQMPPMQAHEDPSTEASGRDEELFEEGKMFAISMATFAVTLMVVHYLMILCIHSNAERQIFRLRQMYLRSILRQDIAWFDAHHTGEFASRTADDLRKLQEGIGDKFGQFNHSFAHILATLAIGFLHDWQLTLLMLSFVPACLLFTGIFHKMVVRYVMREIQACADADTVAGAAFTAIKTVVAFGGESKEAEKYKENVRIAKDAGVLKGLVVGLFLAGIWLSVYSNLAVSLWYGVKLVLDDRAALTDTYKPSTFLVVFFSVSNIAGQIGIAISSSEAFVHAKAAGGVIFSIIDRIPYIDSLSRGGLKPATADGSIQFDNVMFEYPSRQQVRILDGLDLKVESGETVALIGESGCGKSTVVQLLQRFYDPVSGVVKLDNCDIKLLNVGWLRGHIGVVSQEPVLFGTTIAENIRYGLDGATQRDIEKAAKVANAHDFIMQLPEKYETLVGDGGTQLSGGQKQRVAIARALLKNPRILLLDEATSALDTESERIIQEALDKARRGRTTIIIAHRLSTIRNVNKIAVLSAGRVTELGTHDQLMAKEGIYYQMVSTQNGMDNDEPMEMLTADLEIAKPDAQADGQIKDPNKSSLLPIEFASRSPSLLKKRQSSVASEVTTEDVQSISTLLKVLKHNEPEWLYNLLGCLGSLILSFNMPMFSLILAHILEILSDCDVDDTRRQSVFYSMLLFAFGIAVATATFLQMFMFSTAGQCLTQRLRRKLFTSMLKQDLSWFDQQENSIGALCTRLSADTANVHAAAGPRIGMLVQVGGTIGSTVIISLFLNWKLALVTALTLPLGVLATYIRSELMKGHLVLERGSLERANQIAVEAISNVRTVASLHGERTIHTVYREKMEKAHKSAMRHAHFQGIFCALAVSIPMFTQATCLFYGTYMIIHKSLAYATLMKVSQLLILGTMSLGDTITFVPNYSRGMIAAKGIFELIERSTQIGSASSGGETLPDGNPATIQFKNVKFTYPSRPDTAVLRGIDLTIPNGKVVALVGTSGCGKSTCIQLLERFYNPTSGCVTLDDKDISKLNIKWLRSQIGIVSQEPILFNRSIAENIAYGDNSRNASMEEIVQASISANAHGFVSALPQGYDTRVGDKGLQLSGGQKQRIAIARALLRNPKIILLDEATSALDSESEKLVQEAIEEAQKGRTCITVAHRLSTIKEADLIAVIRKGLVVEMGTHDQLIALNGHYHKYYHMQRSGQT